MIPTHDEYTSRIRASFGTAWHFFQAHKKPRTSADWDLIAVKLSDYRDNFTSDLIVAVVDELERECNHAVKPKSIIV